MLNINNITVSYDTAPVLKKLSLNFNSGSIHGILGVNGAGKTTLFKTIYGIIPPQKGEILIEDNDKKRFRQIAYLETENFFYPYMRGVEYLELLSYNNESFDIYKWNKIFNLPLDQLIETYSTGMKKKLALLGIISLERPILLLDEPYNGIDLESAQQLDRILLKLKERNKLIILTSHIFDILKRNCGKISFLHEKTIQETYKKADFSILEERIEALINKTTDSILDSLFQKTPN